MRRQMLVLVALGFVAVASGSLAFVSTKDEAIVTATRPGPPSGYPATLLDAAARIEQTDAYACDIKQVATTRPLTPQTSNPVDPTSTVVLGRCAVDHGIFAVEFRFPTDPAATFDATPAGQRFIVGGRRAYTAVENGPLTPANAVPGIGFDPLSAAHLDSLLRHVAGPKLIGEGSVNGVSVLRFAGAVEVIDWPSVISAGAMYATRSPIDVEIAVATDDHRLVELIGRTTLLLDPTATQGGDQTPGSPNRAAAFVTDVETVVDFHDLATAPTLPPPPSETPPPSDLVAPSEMPR